MSNILIIFTKLFFKFFVLSYLVNAFLRAKTAADGKRINIDGRA